MFEVKIQTYWADADPAGIVFFPHFFRFLEQAEEEMFRSTGVERHALLQQHQVWFPRVEAFAKYVSPIRIGDAIRVQMTPTLKGNKTVRHDYQIVGNATGDLLAHGYFVAVCVDHATFKAMPIPDALREVFTRFQ